MTVVLIIVSIFIFYAIGDNFNKKRQQEASASMQIPKDRGNEFIFWHKKLTKNSDVSEQIKAEVDRMDRERHIRRMKEYPQYIEWCRENNQLPIIPPDGLDGVK